MEKASGAEKTQGLSKVCTKCGAEKPLTEFYKHKECKDGLEPYCKVCRRKRNKELYQSNAVDRCKQTNEYRKKNKEKYREYSKAYRQRNPEKTNKSTINWQKNNPEALRKIKKRTYQKNRPKIKERMKEYQQANLDLFRAHNAKRRAAKLQRTPKWANLEKIKEIYKNCPEGHHVDHIIPLQGENVSGLHVPENLQYLTPSENSAKSNKFEV